MIANDVTITVADIKGKPRRAGPSRELDYERCNCENVNKNKDLIGGRGGNRTPDARIFSQPCETSQVFDSNACDEARASNKLLS